jgi:hypothetical protein
VGLSLNDPNPLKVRIPPSPRQIMGVADPVSVNWAFITNFAARHEGNLPYEIDEKYSIEP